MTINKDNYETYLVSCLEGMLTTEEQALLDAFLHEHPELKQEVSAYKRVFLVPDETITYPNKSLLFKPEVGRTSTTSYSHTLKINRLNYEEYLVSSLEGMLTTEEQASLDSYLHEHPELKPDVDAYKLAFLVADKTISFPDKKLLLKTETTHTIIPFYRRYSVWLSVAACLLVLMVFRFFIYNNMQGTGTNSSVAASHSLGQGYASSVNTSIPAQLSQNYLASSHEIKIASNKSKSTYQTPIPVQQPTGLISEVSTIPSRNATYIPQQQNRRLSTLQSNSSEQARMVAAHLQAERNQSALISNAAMMGKTLLHLSGRQLPSENVTGQQFRVVTVSYDSKDVSFVRIIH